MPKNLVTDVVQTIFPTQTSPIPGEPRTAGSVETPFQNSADRTAYLKDRLEYLDPTKEGARRLRRVESLTALRALVDVPFTLIGHGTIVEVDGIGIYQFDGGSTLAELAPFTIKPDWVTHPAPGRWRIAGAGVGTLDVPNGIPSLDEDGNLPTARLAAAPAGRILGEHIKFGLVDLQHGYVPSCPKTTSVGTFVDVDDPQLTIAAKSGDLLRVSASFLALNDGTPGHACEVSIVTVSPGGLTQEIQGAAAQVYNDGGNKNVGLNVAAPINQNGNWLVKLQIRSFGGGQSWLVDISMTAELNRL